MTTTTMDRNNIWVVNNITWTGVLNLFRFLFNGLLDAYVFELCLRFLLHGMGIIFESLDDRCWIFALLRLTASHDKVGLIKILTLHGTGGTKFMRSLKGAIYLMLED